MREIKFRYTYKRKEDGKIYQEIVDILCLGGRGDKSLAFDLNNPFWDIIARDEYTGLKDKNGNEIYEGDIVNTFSRVGRGFRDRGIDKVHYSDITARWYPPDIVVTEMCEVIGNIYENPELLEG